MRQLIRRFLFSLEFRRMQKLRETTLARANGFAIFVDPNDQGVGSSILRSQGYESHLTEALKRELKPDSVFLDIGCNIGWFVLLAATLSPSGKVIGIEPNEENLQLLYRSIATNGFQHVIVHPYAATDKAALLQLGLGAEYGFVHGVGDTDDSFVQGATVDALVEHEPRIDIVKMDIEGHEPVAIRGMQKTIARHHPLLFTEFHPRLIRDHAGCDPVEYLQTLLGFGYSLSVLTFEGEEIPRNGAQEIMDFWRSLNEQNRAGGAMHLDLIAR